MNVQHEAARLQSLAVDAADAVDRKVHDVRRALKTARRRLDDLQDLKDTTVYHIRRHPLQAAAIAFAAGMTAGVVSAVAASAVRRARVAPGAARPAA